MKKIIEIVFICFMVTISIANAQEPESDEIIRIDTALVTVPAIVVDSEGNYVPNLKAKDFSIYENGSRQEISFFASKEEPLNAALVIDTSISTKIYMDQIKAAAVEFVSLLKPGDKASIITFDREVEVAQDLSANHLVLKNAIGNIDTASLWGTVLTDALFDANESLENVEGRKAIILLCDGGQSGPHKISNRVLMKKLESSDVPVYSIFYKLGVRQNVVVNARRQRIVRHPHRHSKLDRLKEIDRRAIIRLTHLSKVTAGRFYDSSESNMKNSFHQIVGELKYQYRLGYYPEKPLVKGTVYQIKVEAAAPNLTVRSRTTYRAN